MNFEVNSDEYVKRLAGGEPDVGEHFARYFGGLLDERLRRMPQYTEIIEDLRQATLLRVLEIVCRGRRVESPERFGRFVMSGTPLNHAREPTGYT